MNATFRATVLRLHRWTGLTAGLVLAFMAITGISIAYRPQLEPILNPDLLTAPACDARLPLDKLVENARAAHPEGELDYVRITAAAAGAARTPAVQIRIATPRGEGLRPKQDDLFLDPCTGRFLGQRDRYDGVLAQLEQLHRFRFMDGGYLITGTCALLLVLVLVAGGLYMWWPRGGRRLKSAVTVDLAASRHRPLDRHKVVGVYAFAIIGLSALTGLPQSFDWYKDGIYRITGSAAPPKALRSTPTGAPRLSMEDYWRRARELVPNPSEALLHFPSKPTDSVEIYAIPPDAPHANARTLMFLDAYSGKPLYFKPYGESSLGNRLYFWTLSWHMGQTGAYGPPILIAGALALLYLAYSGIGTYWRRRTARAPRSARLEVIVAKKAREAMDICTFELADPFGNPLPQFAAGSHIDVRIREGLVRQYSLCNDPRETHRYLIGVLRTADSRGGSRAMHDDVQQGDRLQISEPKNRFPIAHSASRSLLVAGGIGVTPILCMAERLANIEADFEMHYCTRAAERMAFRERIARSAFAGRVAFHFDDGPAEQRFDAAAVLAGRDSGTHLYVCGPTGFMDMVLLTARRLGWPEERLHREYFAATAPKPQAEREFEIKLASTGRSCRVGADETAIAALARCGINVPTSCEQGVCGTCITRVISGEPDHRDLFQTPEERARNDQFTPCCSRSLGPVLVLDL